MRIAHLLRKYNPVEWGGTETAIQRLFDGLRKLSTSSVVYCPKIKSFKEIADPLLAAGCEVKRFSAFLPIAGISAVEKHQMITLGGNLMSLDLIWSLMQERELSLVHTHALGRIGGIGLKIARHRDIPLVASIHGGVLDLPQKLKAEFNKPAKKGWEWGKVFGLMLNTRGLMEEADAIVTCNPKEAALWQERYPKKHVMVQPHGVPVADYRKDQRQAALDAFPEIKDRQILLCVGRIDSIKNQGWLVQHAAEVFKKHPNAMLVLAGSCTEAKYGENLKNELRSRGLEAKVLLTGGLPPGDGRLLGLIQLAKAVVLSSVSETFGLVLLEAWAAGTAVMSSRTSGATALIKEGENGWLFDLENPGAFHAAVDEALGNDHLRRQYAARGGSLAETSYNTDVLAARMKGLYETLIEEKHALRHSARRRYQRAYAD